MQCFSVHLSADIELLHQLPSGSSADLDANLFFGVKLN
jgi:hypothetical protein